MTAATTAAMTAALIKDHPWVGHVEVRDGTVFVHPAAGLTGLRPEPGPLLEEFLTNWAEIYDWVYGSGDATAADDLDFSGWRASDTGKPLPVEHMTEWLDRTVELVLRGEPRTVLELGSGSGLLLQRLHPHLVGYVGTDVSETSVARLSGMRLPRTVVVPAAAHEITAGTVRDALEAVVGPGAAPDCVLLNSVTQHFPDTAYLRAVLEAAIGAVRAGGTVVVGDIRHAGLLRDHHRWLAAADVTDSSADLERRVTARAEAEEEFLADPRLLASIAAGHPRPVSVSLHAKTLRDDTELTRYRYDAVLHVEPTAVPEAVPVSWTDIPGPARLAGLRHRLDLEPRLFVTGIPNALLTAGPTAVTAFDVREAVAGTGALVGIDVTDPTLLTVGSPSTASRPPAATIASYDITLAHEPLARFVERRLHQALGDQLRRAGAGLTDIRVVRP